MSDLVKACRHRKEKSRGALTLLVGGAVWLLVLLLVGVAVWRGRSFAFLLIGFYVVAFALLRTVAAALACAYSYGHHVLLSDQQLPHLHRMVVDGAAELGLKQAPRAFLANSNGLFDAFARRLLGRRHTYLTAALVEAESDAQIRFVIGHELGHHAAGHLDRVKNLVRAPSRFVPLLFPAYQRSRELTCDRIGASLSGGLQTAGAALQMLAGGCGGLNEHMNPDVFENQDQLVPTLSGFLLKFVATHPHTCSRVRELRLAA